MPPERTALGSISGNSRRGPDLSPFQRGQISGMKTNGATPTQISKRLKFPISTVRSTIGLEHLREDGASQRRSGRPLSYTPAEERRVLRHVRSNPKETYQQVIEACSLGCSKNTVKKILLKHGIKNWKCKRRPFLTPKNAAARLAWCKKHRHTTPEEWGTPMWSDECSVERGRGKRDEWAFRTPAQKWQPEMVQTYGTGKNMKVMVWGCFWDNGRTNLYIMDRDFESAKHGYSAESYLEVLEAEVAPTYTLLEKGYKFMQDNASIHTAHKVRDWFKAHRILQLKDWPPYSPDLNPIEHIW